MDWVLDLRSDSLTPIFLALTFLGDVSFFLLVLPPGYWLWRRGTFARLTLLLLATALVNSALKGFFRVPRPEIPHLVEAHGWSFPSGHAQISAAIWPYLAWELRRTWAWALAVFVVIGVAASRVYLGVHYPTDVLAGAGIGLAMAALAALWHERAGSGWRELSTHTRAVLVAGLVAVGLAVIPGGADRVPVVAGGALLGFGVGEIYERRHLAFAAPAGLWRRLAAVALGLGGVFGLRIGLKAGLGALELGSSLADFLRYSVLGLWLSYLAPWLFCRLGLCGVQENRPANTDHVSPREDRLE